MFRVTDPGPSNAYFTRPEVADVYNPLGSQSAVRRLMAEHARRKARQHRSLQRAERRREQRAAMAAGVRVSKASSSTRGSRGRDAHSHKVEGGKGGAVATRSLPRPRSASPTRGRRAQSASVRRPAALPAHDCRFTHATRFKPSRRVRARPESAMAATGPRGRARDVMTWAGMSDAKRVDIAPPMLPPSRRTDFLQSIANLPPTGAVEGGVSFLSAEVSELWDDLRAAAAAVEGDAKGEGGAGGTSAVPDAARHAMGLAKTVELLASGQLQHADGMTVVESTRLLDVMSQLGLVGYVGWAAVHAHSPLLTSRLNVLVRVPVMPGALLRLQPWCSSLGTT